MKASVVFATVLALALPFGAAAQPAPSDNPGRNIDTSLLSKPTYKVTFQSNVRVPMRDGVTLATDIYRPDAPGKFPAILERTPYNRATYMSPDDAKYYASRGYVVVLQDVRGTYDSDGVFYAFKNEANDGYDTDEWIGHQDWSDGGIGTMGGSYVGYTQWAQAVAGSKYLKAMVMTVTTSDIYGNWIYIDGVSHYGFDLPWGGIEMSAHVMQNTRGFDWPPIYNHLPVATSAEAGHHVTPHYQDWFAHPTRDSYWDGISFEKQSDYAKVSVPILSMDGWYDIFLRGDIRDDAMMHKVGATQVARDGKRLMIGPWAHSTGGRTALPVGSNGSDPTPVDFGDDTPFDKNIIHLRWFDHYLKGINNGVGADAPYQIFVMGENRWRNEKEWPLARTKYTNYYIQSGGRANSVNGDGVLTTDQPKGSESDKFSYNPANPTPTMGGNVCCSNVPSGPWDQRAVERRDDVLVYTTEPVTRKTEITGPVKMELYAASSAKDTDFTAKLVDVRPDGYAQNIQSGIVRARFRDGGGKAGQLIDPGKVYAYTIDMWATSYALLPGHRLRLEVSSSDFPRFDRNLNTGEDPNTGTRMMVANQTIYHSSRYPSHVVLPLIPDN
jgi:putative CocE/NonD family hydrolase